VHNPADGSLLAQVVDCGAAEAQAAAEAACRSLASWRSRPAKDRSSLLRAGMARCCATSTTWHS
jgi:succinate-semialdehyde dehydrogenase/glutarate-semialdehyde dehydrogenase